EGATLTLRQMGILRDRTGHAYQVTADGGFLIMTGSVEGARIYRANPKQELIAAVSKKTGFAPVAIPAADAQRELDAEFAFWAAIADAP
ncbi:MAG: hypothetical protein KGJ84_13515, partial [Elusimicrobia bacterium]|nr:hypothetical protein [Elusimicrobiota bacterium]